MRPSVHDFARARAEGRKISMLTCYDAWSARLLIVPFPLNHHYRSGSLDVPDGKPEEILAFIQQLENTEIQGQTEEEALAQFKKVHHARIAGCDKILAGQTTA